MELHIPKFGSAELSNSNSARTIFPVLTQAYKGVYKPVRKNWLRRTSKFYLLVKNHITETLLTNSVNTNRLASVRCLNSNKKMNFLTS